MNTPHERVLVRTWPVIAGFRFLALAVTICVAFNPGLLAFQPDIALGTIQGRVLLPSGEKNLPNEISATLTLRSRAISILKEVHSGTFEFGDLEDGNYTIKIRAAGFEDCEENVTIIGAERGVVVEVTIQLGETTAGDPHLPPANGANTVSKDLLAVPKKALGELEKASQASRKGDIDGAIAHLQKALKVAPDFHQALNNLGVQYMRKGNVELARETFRHVLEVHPGDPSATFNLGLLCSLDGQDEEAAAFYEAVLEQESENSRAVAYLAESRFNLGDFSRALEAYQRAARMEPGQLELLLRVADCLTQLSRFAEAIATLRDFLQKAPSSPLGSAIREQIRNLETFQ